jgi:hypothetical protein
MGAGSEAGRAESFVATTSLMSDFQTVPIPDDRVFDILDCIARDTQSEHDRNQVSITVEGSVRPFSLSTVREQNDVANMLETRARVARIIVATLYFQGYSLNISIERLDGYDQVKVTGLPDQFEVASRVASVVRTAFKKYDRFEVINSELAPALAALYDNRELLVSRLEGTTVHIFEQNVAYRKQLDESHLEAKRALNAEIEGLRTRLEGEYQAKAKDLQEERERIELQLKELDNRNNTHARRQIHKDLKAALQERHTTFTLTRDTSRKRYPIRVAFAVIGAFLIVVAGVTLWRSFGLTSDPWAIARSIGSLSALVIMTIFYIKWEDSWSQAHADEEFRLKRFDLDVDRASWLVEVMLEWKAAEGGEIPNELLERLSNGLFEPAGQSESLQHPVEHVLAGLLSSPAAVRVKFPNGEAEFDKGSIKKAKQDQA